jgi:predicted enzyme related to lactoylglutathione lyase
MPPTSTNGKICYIEMPATDVARSAEFYEKVFGWRIRKRGDGATAFDDATGQVSGAFVLGRPPSGTPGLLVCIMVDRVEQTMEKIKRAGGEIVQNVGADAGETTARFRDPGGNVLGLYQEPTASSSVTS